MLNSRRQANPASRVRATIGREFASCVVGLLVAAWVASSLQAAETGLKSFPGMLKLTVDDEVIEGRPIAWSVARVHLLGRDGRLWEFSPRDARDWQQAPHFKPYTVSQIRAELLRELGREYAVTGSSHYMVAHAAGQRDRWAERFEELYRTFVHYFRVRGFTLKKPEFPLIGVVCRDRAHFARYSAAQGSPAPPGVLGYYSLTSNRIMLYDIDPREGFGNWHETAKTIIHEATHQAAFNTGIHSRYTPPPLWVAEGLATLFEAPGVCDPRNHTSREDRINQGRLDDFRRAVLPRHEPKLIKSLVASDGLFGSNSTAAYAESWALTFFLVETRPRKYAAYVTRTADRPPFSNYSSKERVADFEAVFGDNWELLESHFLRFIAGLP